ncbi:MAG: FG-GAP-like repeat-containing protein [Candidatus Cloacimonetes bacterium]|nr:FG-GAP-like repeat-containing protein [Candidatus Cloacimonadota bacterium]
MSKLPVLCLAVIWLAMIVKPLPAQANYIDVMTHMSGEFGGSEFGESIASLDFNGDGYMDLVVSSGAWNPYQTFAVQNRWGKLYFYWGGPGFDNIPDFVIPGAFNWQMGPGTGVFNAGDMNGDGIEDLIMFQRSPAYDNNIAVFFGRANPQNSPDIILTYADNSGTGVNSVSILPLGDVNGDNHDDICLVLYYADGSKEVYIWSDNTSQPWLFKSTSNQQARPRLCGIGDVNNDGFDDTLSQISISPSGETHTSLVLYYGSPTFPQTDSLVICEDSNSIIKSWACPLGDVNGDGYDDFTAGSLIYDYSQHLWLGGDSLSAPWSLDLSGDHNHLPHQISERGTGYPMVHGDLNGDGYQDVLGFDSEAGYYSGYLYLWMGSPTMNGSMDYLRLEMDGYYHTNYGWSKVTGDFNADGFCDVAVGAPWFSYNDHIDTGRVYVLAGNPDLHETTVANDDDTLPVPNADKWRIEVYPNPFNPSTTITFSIPETGRVRVSVYNIKGRKVKDLINTEMARGNHKLIWDGKDTNSRNVGSGIYLFKLESGGNTSIRKAMLVK